MDFFEKQIQAKIRTRWLVLLFVLAVIGIILSLYIVFIGLIYHENLSTLSNANSSLLNFEVLGWIALGVLAIVGGGALYKTMRLSSGGAIVAESLGGRLIARSTLDLKERQLLNVVEEMSIASGVVVPSVYLLDEEGINAFAAGFSPNDAVIGITRGALDQLNRDELQGVIAHEFSHILNGDMRLNMRLIGTVFGILMISTIGYHLLRSCSRARSDRKGNGVAVIIVVGLSLWIIGLIGVFFGRLIQAAVSRQREFLADAAAVQFTRNPAGIGGALQKLLKTSSGSAFTHPSAAEFGHFYFANGISNWWGRLFATHPPIEKRLHALEIGDISSRNTRQSSSNSTSSSSALNSVSSQFSAPNNAAEQLIAQVGKTSAAQVEYSQSLIQSLPSPVIEALKTPEGAESVVLALLMSRQPEIHQEQLALLQSSGRPGLVLEVEAMLSKLASLDGVLCLPVVEIAMPALRELSSLRLKNFEWQLNQLIALDGFMNLFEFSLLRLIRKHLSVHTVLPRIRYQTIKSVAPEAITLLSAVAHAGMENPSDIGRAFRRGAMLLRLEGALPVLLDKEKIGIGQIDEALNKLVEASPRVKKMVLSACAETASSDNVLGLAEIELLRAISYSLDCPVPPVPA